MAETPNPMHSHGSFGWCELLTNNVEAAKTFYAELFGWSMEPFPGMPYTVIKNGDTGIGGIMELPPHMAGAPPCWGTYVTVADVDATAQKAQALGATTIVPLTDIPEVGRFYVFRDPQGAVISAITYRM